MWCGRPAPWITPNNPKPIALRMGNRAEGFVISAGLRRGQGRGRSPNRPPDGSCGLRPQRRLRRRGCAPSRPHRQPTRGANPPRPARPHPQQNPGAKPPPPGRGGVPGGLRRPGGRRGGGAPPSRPLRKPSRGANPPLPSRPLRKLSRGANTPLPSRPLRGPSPAPHAPSPPALRKIKTDPGIGRRHSGGHVGGRGFSLPP